MKTRILAEPVLVGRERELEELQGLLDLVITGKGKTVFISGEAGSGKTRLTSEFLRIAKEKEIEILQGYCLSNTSMPYFPFIEAFDIYLQTEKDQKKRVGLQKPEGAIESEMEKQVEYEALEVKAWLMGLKQVQRTGGHESLSPEVWKDLAFAALTKTLLSISHKKPTVLFIDDLHWADSASLSLLNYISRAIASERILILGTFRSEEITTDAEGHPHPLMELLRAVRREDLLEEIRLSSLGKVEVSKIAENMIGGSLDSNLVEKLSKESQGNPLFVVESLRMLSDRKSLVQKNGQWFLAGDSLSIPSKFRDIILRRLGTLKLSQRRVLDVASVIGEKFSPEVLAAALSEDSLGILEALNEIENSTSLVFCEAESYRFDHAKSREVVYGEIPPPLRRGYHGRIAQRLESNSFGSGELPLGDIAYHYDQAGNKDKAVEYAFAAGKDALARFGNTEAIKHFTYVIKIAMEDPAHADKRANALQGLGEAFFAISLFKEAMKTFERIYSSETGSARLRAFRWAMDSAFFQGDIDRLVELSKEGEQCATDDRLECARVRMNRGRTNLLLGNYKAGLEDFEEALRVDEEEYFLPDTARTLVGLGIAYSTNGQLLKALGAELRAIALYEELGDLRGKMDACNRAGQTSIDLQQAEDFYSKAIEIGEKIGDYNRAAEASCHLGIRLEVEGDLPRALSNSLKAQEYSKKIDSTWTMSYTYANLIRQYTKLEQIEKAEEYFEKLDKLQPWWGPQNRMIEYVLSKAVLSAGKKRWKESTKYFNEVFEWCKVMPRSGPLAMASYIWALNKQGRTEEAKIYQKQMQCSIEELLKGFDHINIQAYLMAPIKVGIGQAFEVRLDIVNVSKKHCTLVKIENLLLPEFKVAVIPREYGIQNGSMDLKEKKLEPFQLTTIRLNLKAKKIGAVNIDPKVVYIGDEVKGRSCYIKPVKIIVLPTVHAKIGGDSVSVPILPGRVSTGFADLDMLLFGGIPENYAVILSAPPSDERELLIKCFLEAGVIAEQPTFYITGEVGPTKTLEKKDKSNFYLFICNPRADAISEDYPNLFKLKGVENLTDIDIALIKVFRTLSNTYLGTKRACIEILSDVLLQHHSVVTRKWLIGLLTDLRSKGFTTLAIIDTQMHPKEETQAILGLFDGELRISQSDSEKGLEKSLKVIKLHNQKYLNRDLSLTRKKDSVEVGIL